MNSSMTIMLLTRRFTRTIIFQEYYFFMKTEGNVQPTDVIFLRPACRLGQKSRGDRPGILFCDQSGKVHLSRPDPSVTSLVSEITSRKARWRVPLLFIGLETIPGRYLPVVVKIGKKESSLVQRLSRCAGQQDRLPEELKAGLKSLINIPAAGYELVIPVSGGQRTRLTETMPLPTKGTAASETAIEISLPLYKAGFCYPLIVLKKLPPAPPAPPGTCRLLVIDGDGELAIVWLPESTAAKLKTLEGAPEGLPGTGMLVPGRRGPAIGFLHLDRDRYLRLRSIVRHFEKTGKSPGSIQASIRSIISLAKASLPT